MFELSRLANQPRCMRQRSYGNRSVIGRHAAELVACDQRRPSTQVGGAQCGDYPGGSCTYDDDVNVPFIHITYLKSEGVGLELFLADCNLATS